MLVCSNCSNRFSTDQPRWCCDCGGYLLLQDRPNFSRESLRKRPPGLWRYHEGLGISDLSHAVSLGEGSTPLIQVRLGGDPVRLKLDYLCPTGSYKDRGSAVMMGKLKEWGVTELVEDSSGNAGASIAAYAAAAGGKAHIFVPESTSAGKAAQIAMYGANLVKVPGSRSDAADAARDAASRIFYGSHNWSPYFLAGLKTAAYEIAEQMASDPPDWIVTPAGGGGLLAGLYLGFLDLLEAGIIRRIPRLAAIQSACCDPIYRAWTAGHSDVSGIRPVPTAAEGIAVTNPVRGKTVLEAIRASGGIVRTVADDAIWDMVATLGRQGIYVEPTAAAAPAMLAALRAEGTVAPDDRVVVILTGSGLKATDKIVAHFTPPDTATVPA